MPVSQRNAAPPSQSSEPDALKRFIGQDLVAALGRLDDERIMGVWPGRRPAKCRGEESFSATLYGDDHAHGHAEMCLLIEGRCRFSLAQGGAILEAGDMVICPAGIPHAEACVTPGRAYRLVWWSLHDGDPTIHVTRYSGRGGYVLDHRMSLNALPGEPSRRLDRLRTLAAGSRVPSADALREAMLTVTLALYRRILDGGADRWDTREVVVQRASTYVRAHSDRALSLAEVAREVRVSPNYLTSLFRAVAGKPLGRFIADERMARASELLQSTHLSVKEVAGQLGFNDAYGFSRTFKAFSGRSPSQWRASRVV